MRLRIKVNQLSSRSFSGAPEAKAQKEEEQQAAKKWQDDD
jgi:hypothetical protein